MVDFKELKAYNLDNRFTVRKLRNKPRYRVSLTKSGKIVLSNGSKKEAIDYVKNAGKNKGNATQINLT